MGFALLKVRPLAPANEVEYHAGDSVFVIMPRFIAAYAARERQRLPSEIGVVPLPKNR